MSSVTFNIPKRLDSELKRLARQKMLTKSALLRLVLADHVEQEKTVNGNDREPKRKTAAA